MPKKCRLTDILGNPTVSEGHRLPFRLLVEMPMRRFALPGPEKTPVNMSCPCYALVVGGAEVLMPSSGQRQWGLGKSCCALSFRFLYP